MNDQAFINTYVRILNDTLTEAFNKNIVLQAQLEVATANANKAAELENRLRELSNVLAENNALQEKIVDLSNQLELATKKYNNLESFKRELIESRMIIKSQTTELHRLKYGTEPAVTQTQSEILEEPVVTIETVEEDSKKKKKNKQKESHNNENNVITVNETF